MKTLFILLMTTLFLNSCGEEQSGVKVPEEVFLTHVNQKAMPAEVNLNTEKSFLNREYPIEIALYSNGTWFYDLPNLGTGKGTYKYEDGKLKLHSPRDLFDMNIDVLAADEKGDSFLLSFRDRFGFVTLKTELMNKAQ